jgi:hypothetical protein
VHDPAHHRAIRQIRVAPAPRMSDGYRSGGATRLICWRFHHEARHVRRPYHAAPGTTTNWNYSRCDAPIHILLGRVFEQRSRTRPPLGAISRRHRTRPNARPPRWGRYTAGVHSNAPRPRLPHCQDSADVLSEPTLLSPCSNRRARLEYLHLARPYGSEFSRGCEIPS